MGVVGVLKFALFELCIRFLDLCLVYQVLLDLLDCSTISSYSLSAQHTEYLYDDMSRLVD